MSLRIDFSELAATQFFVLPHDVYSTIRSELIAMVLGESSVDPREGTLSVATNGFVFEVKFQLDRAKTYVRVLSIQKLKGKMTSVA